VEPPTTSAADLPTVSQAPRQPALAADLPATPAPPPPPDAAADLPATPAAIALDGADMISGLAPTGGWLVQLGAYDSPPAAQAAWRRLRGAHAELLGGMTRMAGSEGGRQPLLVGPLATEEDADRICRALVARGESCEKLQV
jgi:cell division septation protein DedD